MWGTTSWSASRQAKTTMICKHCPDTVTVQRSCQSVSLVCESCGKRYELQDYLKQMDDVLEDFMENVYCDRV